MGHIGSHMNTAGAEQRTSERITIEGTALVTAARQNTNVRLRNISAGGALVGPMFGIDIGQSCQIDLPGYGAVRGRVCRVTSDNDVAICFTPEPGFRAFCADTDGLAAAAARSRISFGRATYDA